LADKKDRNKPIQQNPFTGLKGFCVSTPAEKSPAKQAKPPAAPPANEDETELFAAEMARLGVDRRETEAEAPAGEETGGASVSPPFPPSDRELFLDALKGMDTVFADELPPPEEPLPSPRRMKLLRQGRLVPEATLDLHGLTRDEARQRVRYFLDDSLYQGLKTVLIVTGRGKGSGGEPVLRAEVERYLNHEAGAWVHEWGRAPRRYGGEGALAVFLKGGKKGT